MGRYAEVRLILAQHPTGTVSSGVARRRWLSGPMLTDRVRICGGSVRALI